MIRNYFKSAFRSLVKHKIQSALSILSITIGLSVSIIIFLFVQDEFSYDAYHKNARNIYRLANNWKSGDNVTPWARTSTPMAPAMQYEYPEIEEIVRVRKNPRTDLLAIGDKKFYENGLYFADPNVFNVFSWNLKVGNPATALANKNSVVLTQKIANKYFGTEDPIGQVLTYDNKYELTVTGILEEIPSNSHFTFELLADFKTVEDVLGKQRTENWFWFDIQTYLLLKPNVNVKELEEKFPGLIKNNIPEQYAGMFGLFLQPLTSIHLTSDLKDELEKNSNAKYSYILLTVALFIMLMACINFINQTTASFTTRSTELGVRKVFGAFKIQLITQYLVEALVLTFIAFILGILLVLIILPYFNELTNKGIQFFTMENVRFFGYLVLFAVLVGLVSGSYPAIYLSNLKPINAIKGTNHPGRSSWHFRNILVTLQVCVSLILIISTFVVSDQLNYFQTTNFGFDKEYMVIIPIKDRSENGRHKTLTNQLEEHSSILNATFTSSVPGSDNSMSFYFKPVGSEMDAERIATFLVDDNFKETFNLNQLEGLELPIDQKEDTIEYIIVNESFVALFGLEDPIGKLVNGSAMNKIIGVVEDFNIKSLHHQLEPAILSYRTNWFRHVAVKVNSNNIPEALEHIEEKWNEFYPGYPFDYAFLDDNIDLLYKSEQKLNVIFKIFTGIAILIGGLGLMSLASFIVSQRTREIGIRKVLGSSVPLILFLFTQDFIKLILIAVLVGVPVTYFLVNEWLASFAHRIAITPDFFILPVLSIILLLFATIGYQVTQASLLNPVDTLKYE